MNKIMNSFVIAVVCISFVHSITGSNVGTTQTIPEPDYKADDITYDDGGFAALYDLARKFINLALPDSEQLIQDVIGIIKGTKSVDLDYFISLVKGTFLGYSICVVIGFLFFIIFPIVGCCFCCCRLCCQCCCDKPEQEDPKASCKKKVYSVFLFVFVAITAAGNACIFVSNGQISTAIDNINTAVDENLDDVDTFINHTIKQVDSVTYNFNTTKLQVQAKLDANVINKTLSDQALSILTTGSVEDLQNEIGTLSDAIDGIQQENTQLSNSCAKLPTVLCDPSTLPVLTLPTIPPEVKDIKGEATKTLQEEIGNAVNDVATNFADANKQLNDVSGQVYSAVSDLKSVLTDLNGFDTQSIKDMVDNTVTLVKPYDKYRWYAGVGCGGMVSLILGLQFFGMICAACGRCGKGADPTSKGCMSNSGGRMMIASDVFLFPFCTILMLLTTLLFVPGSLLERYVCQPLTDPELSLFNTVLKDVVDINSFLTYQAGYEPNIGKMLSNCKNNEAVYKAFNVDKLTSFTVNFTEIEEMVKSAEVDIQKSLNDTLKDLFSSSPGSFGTVQLLPPGLDTALGSLAAMDFSQLELQLDAIKTQVDTAKNQTLASSFASDLTAMENSLNKMEKYLKTIKDTQPVIQASVAKVKSDLQNATQQMQSKGMASIAKSFVDSIFKKIDDFLQNTIHTVTNDFGKCRPVWNLYDSLIDVSLCKYTVDSLNGFWFSIGWCIFFLMPTAIFGTKLSNLIRDVDFIEEMDDVRSDVEMNNYQRNITSNRNAFSKHLGPNRAKVGHRDW